MKHGLIILLLLINTALIAKESHSNQLTAVPDNSRFSIIQSEASADMTFRLDKFTGSVSRMIEGNRGPIWLKLKREKHAEDIQQPQRVNYQVFTSGLNVKMIYMSNIHTGVTWYLSENSKLGIFWKAIK
ncbi:MAG: hypothetical protein U9N52_01765 [Campylobacterota bacterium]|nr:hypothetical protein [Campylobacterota bacterium]